MPDRNCPPESDLQALVTGALEETRVQALEAHLLECDACSQRTVNAFADDTLIAALRKKARLQPWPKTIDEQHVNQLMQTFEALHPALGSCAEPAAPAATTSEPPPAAPEELPTVLGNYDLLQLIGAGGMGQVYQARHRRMNRIVALKVLSAETMRDPTVIARFEREVKVVSAISHPNIVAAYDADQAEDTHFLVMEYVEGSDLSELVKRSGPFSVEQAVDCILQVARGLQAAHLQGIVHRDIKPANLLLDKTGTIKILDMGLARFHGDGPAQAELTASGMVMGTVDYMSPEQALDSRAVDGRADIYSLGCTLHYLLTGRTTYEGYSFTSRILAHREQPIPDLQAARQDISEPLEAVFKKMVAKRASERYQSMEELIADLERLQPATALRRRKTDIVRAESDTTAVGPSAITPSVTPSRATPVSAGKARGLRQRLLACGGAAALVLTVVVIFLKGPDGTKLEIRVNEPDAEILITNDQGTVEIRQLSEADPVIASLKPGKKRIRIQKAGFETYTNDDFEIKTGEGYRPISVTLVRQEAQVPTSP